MIRKLLLKTITLAYLGLLFSLPAISFSQKCTAIKDAKFILPYSVDGQCHSPTIVELENGDLISAWFAGSNEGANDVCIWSSTCKKGKWQTPSILAKGEQSHTTSLPCWNPVLFKSASNRLFLFYKVGENPREWWGMIKYSDDGGKNWSSGKKIPGQALGPIKNKPVDLGNGTFLCPSSIETQNNQWISYLELFSNQGQFIRKIDIDHKDSIQTIQPTILKHSDKNLQILCRSKQNRIASSISKDGGKTWTPFELLKVKNPNSGIDALKLKNGIGLLVYNPLTKGNNWWDGRNILSIAISEDGITWQKICDLEKHDSGKYSYPAVIQDSNEEIQILYTWDRKNIKHITLTSGHLSRELSSNGMK